MEEISKLINDYWKFDDNQGHASNWHDKQDLLEAVKKAKIFSSNCCEECKRKLEDGAESK